MKLKNEIKGIIKMTDKSIEHLQQELKEKDKTISCIIESLQAKTKECEKLKKEKENEIQNTVEMERLAKSYGQDLMIYKQNKDIEVNSLKDDILFYLKLIKKIETYCNQQKLKYDTTACEVLNIINKAKDGKNGNYS